MASGESGGEKARAERATTESDERAKDQNPDPWGNDPEVEGTPSWSRLAALDEAPDGAEEAGGGGLLGADPALLEAEADGGESNESNEMELLYDEAFAAELGLDSVVSAVPIAAEASPPPPQRMPPLPPNTTAERELERSLDSVMEGMSKPAAADAEWDDSLADPWDQTSASSGSTGPLEAPFSTTMEGPALDAPFEEGEGPWTPPPNLRGEVVSAPPEPTFGLLSPADEEDEQAPRITSFDAMPATAVREIEVPPEAFADPAPTGAPAAAAPESEPPHPGLEPLSDPPADLPDDMLVPELSLSVEMAADELDVEHTLEPDVDPMSQWVERPALTVNHTGGFSALQALGEEPIDLDTHPRRRRKSRVSRNISAPPPEPPTEDGSMVGGLASEASIDASIEAAFAPIDDGPLLEEISNGFADMVTSPAPVEAPLDDAAVAARIPNFSPAPGQIEPVVEAAAAGHVQPEAAVLPRLPALPEGLSPRDRALLDHLQSEIEAEADPARLALLHHGLARVVHAAVGPCEYTVATLWAAYENDAGFAVNTWLLGEALAELGEIETAVDLYAELDTPAARIRAGHLALQMRDTRRGLALWSGAALGDHLARFVHACRQADDDARLALLESLSEAVEGENLRNAFTVLRVLAAGEGQGALVELAADDAAFAALEAHALSAEDDALLERAWQARIQALATDEPPLDERAAWGRAEAHLKLAWSLGKQGDPARALAQCQAALALCPSDPYLLQWSIAQAREADDTRALGALIEQWTRLATNARERAAAHYQLGLLAEGQGDGSGALAAFETALQADPGYAPALSALGRAAIRQGEWDEVRRRWDEELDSASDADPERVARHLFRVARLVEEDLRDPEAALAYDLRALAAQPGFTPSFLAVEHAYERAGDWRALLNLYLEAAEAAPTTGGKVARLLAAAEVARTRMDDDENAGRIFARALSADPESLPALRAAAACFGRLGLQAARIEVEARWGQLDPNAGRRLLRAAELQELDGDGLAAAAEALPLFREALTRIPDEPAAIDGLVRAVGRTGRVGELISQIERHDLAAVESPMLLLSIAEALLSAGYVQQVAELVQTWRAAGDEGLPAELADALNCVELTVAERLEAWPQVVDLLIAQAQRTAGLPRATRLARAGEIQEHRLADPAQARAAYQDALAADPDCVAAADGLARLAAVEDGGTIEDGIFDAAWQAAHAGDTQALAVALVEKAALSQDEDWADACRAVAGVQSVDDVVAAFEAAPARTDRFMSAVGALRPLPDGYARLVDVLRRRAAHAPAEAQDCHFEIALRALGAADLDTAQVAVEALLTTDPEHIGGQMLALRLAAAVGRDQSTSLRAVAERMAAPETSAALWVAAAAQAQESGSDPGLVADMHRRAFALDPTQAGAADALIAHLEQGDDAEALRDAYDARLGCALDPADRTDLVQRRARLVADTLGDPAGALAALVPALAESPAVDLGLYAADLAARVGDDAGVDQGYQAALDAATEDERVAIQRRYASLLIDRGQDGEAVALLEAVIAADPQDTESLSLLAEAEGRRGHWRQVVEIYHRLFELETDDASRATRAMAIAEVLSRVKKDHNRAAGWFKRAVELDPGRIRATWRLLAEVDQLAPEAVPVEHVHDALDRAAAAVRLRVGAEWGQREPLQSLARLHHRRGNKDARFLACAALHYLGLAGEVEEKIFQRGRGKQSPTTPALTQAQRTQLVTHPGELTVAGSLFDVFALLLSETLADRMPAGCARLSRRSHAEWQRDLRGLAASLGVEEVELWNAGPATHYAACFLPQPALGVPADCLDRPLSGRQRFELVAALDGLRGGRALIERQTRQVMECLGVVAQVAAPELQVTIEADTVPAPVRSRLASRAHRLPQRLRMKLAAIAETQEVLTPASFGGVARAVRHTRHRFGWLACGDLTEALDAILFPDHDGPPDPADRAREALASEDAQALIEYAVSAEAVLVRAHLNEAE